MSSSDRSRTSDDLRYHYQAVVAQQGRVIVDRDFNALETIVNGRAESNVLAIVGPAGTPDNGFAISVPTVSPPLDAIGAASASPYNFAVGAGTLYVGGQRVELPAAIDGVAQSWSYASQPDWLRPNDPEPQGSPPVFPEPGNSPTSSEVVWLEAYEQEVSATEDPDLKEVALGGPDTTARVRLMGRVRRTPVHEDDCAGAWLEATSAWTTADGLAFNPDTMSLQPEVRLQVSFQQDPSSTDPCDPVAQGGYLYAENQLIRVQIGAPTNAGSAAPSILWGYDDASFLYRVTVNGTGTQLQLADSPPDAFHWPVSGQLIEVLRTAVILGTTTDPNNPSSAIVRCMAEACGAVRTLSEGYGATTQGGTANYLTFTDPLPSDYLTDPNPLFVRIWQSQVTYSMGSTGVALTDASGTSNGVVVKVTTPQTVPMTQGAFWMIALRPATPQAVYPERFLTDPQPPDGPRRWACPLATIDWSTVPPGVTNCLPSFQNLVELSKRPGGCCTVNVRPDDLDARTLQQIIDDAVAAAQATEGKGAIKVCFAPGVYFLAAPLRLTRQHALIRLEGCNGEAVLRPRLDADATLFLDGLVVVSDAERVTMSGLSFGSVGAPVLPEAQSLLNLLARTMVIEVDAWKNTGRFSDTRLWNDPSTVLPGIVAGLTTTICVRSLDCPDLTFENCEFFVAPLASTEGQINAQPGGNTLAIGLLAQGACTGLTVRRCTFAGETELATPGLVLTALEKFRGDIKPAAKRAPKVATLAGNPLAAPTVSADHVAPDTTALLHDLPLAFDASALTAIPSAPAIAAGVGLLVAPWISAEQRGKTAASVTFGFGAEALLQDATISENVFSGLTLGAASVARSGLVRATGNTIKNCAGGLWFASWRTPSFVFNVLQPVREGADGLLYYALLCEETLVGLFAPMCLSLPDGFEPGEPLLSGPDFTLVVTGNDIDCRPLPASPNASSSSFALAIFNDVVVSSPALQTATLIFTSNHAQASLPLFYPTMLAMFDGNLTMTGNHVLNVNALSAKQLCYSVMVDPGVTAATPGSGLAVTGNVFQGLTNLQSYPRPATIPVPFNNWDSFNAFIQ